MARQTGLRAPAVIVTRHAHKRWLERANRPPSKPEALAAMLKDMLFNFLRNQGVQTSADLLVVLDMGEGVRALLTLENYGWRCKTILGPEEPHISEVSEG